MGFLNNLLHGPAVLAMKNAEPETPTIMDSMPEAISWPTDAEFAGYANGMYCREYAVRVVVDFISRQLASLPLKVYRKNADGDAEEVRDGALAKLIRHPSDLPGMSRYRFYATLIRDMLLEDRWLCTLGTYRLPDPRIVLDIGYIDGLNLGDPITDVLRPLLAEARVMAKYRKSIAENGYQIPAYVYRPKEMPWESQADYDDFTQGLRNYVAGGGMAGTWPVFKDGMEIRTVDNLFKPVDMADLEAREKINEQVCLAFQISPENIGFRTGTNSNIAAYKEKLWNVELLPYLVAFEEALNLTLPEAVGEPDCYIKANLDAKLRGTMETQYQALSTATGRPFMTTDEARELLDRPKLPGGDQLITPLNVSEGGQPSPQDGGQTQNAQQGASPNGKQMLAEFKRLYTYDAGFRASWDSMTKGETSDES